MLVLRVEGVNGGGPYNSSHSITAWAMDEPPSYVNHDIATHPEPESDGMDFFPRGWVFGFSSDEQLVYWFFQEGLRDGKALDLCGLSISFYEVEEESTIKGGRQLCFDRDASEQIDSMPCEEYFNERGHNHVGLGYHPENE